jgi:hypothetical protein
MKFDLVKNGRKTLRPKWSFIKSVPALRHGSEAGDAAGVLLVGEELDAVDASAGRFAAKEDLKK